MLKQRVITAIILAPLFVLLVLKLSALSFCVFTGAMMLWCACEWSGLMGVKKFPQSLIYPALMLAALFGAMWLYIPSTSVLALIGWLIALWLVVIYPRGSQLWGKGVFIRGGMGFLVLIPCWLAINFIRNYPQGPYILLFLFILIWGADTGAYFAGKFFGKHKIAPLVSPGKTWEGLIGALIVTVLINIGVIQWMQLPFATGLALTGISLLTVLFSVLGDLFESMLKRKENLKDSGRLLPGHGGILDRIDSLTAAAPVFLLGLYLIM